MRLPWYFAQRLGIQYREDQKNLRRIQYTNPNDLFLTGVMEDRRGTCGNMSLLFMVLCRRLGLPVSLACVGAHHIARYQRGSTAYNIEASSIGADGDFSCSGDDFYCKEYQISPTGIACGSDLRPVTPREMLALFLGARARHLENTNRMEESEPDYLLARALFPKNRYLYISENQVSVQCSMVMFEPRQSHLIFSQYWLRFEIDKGLALIPSWSTDSRRFFYV